MVLDWKESAPLKVEVRAAVTILKGEELTFNYLGLLRTSQERNDQLMRRWCFQCCCLVCSLPVAERNKNDMTRELITFHMELASSVSGLASLSNDYSVLNDYLHVLVACYSIEQESKDILPIVLCICNKLYKAVKVVQASWECPKEISDSLVGRLGENFMENLQEEAVRKAVVLGSEMLRVVSDIDGTTSRKQVNEKKS